MKKVKSLLQWVLSIAATAALVTVFAVYPHASGSLLDDGSLHDGNLIANDVTQGAAETVSISGQDGPSPADSGNRGEDEKGYYLREYDGRLAVFAANDAKPLYVFSVAMSTMSDYDKEALKAVIYAQYLDALRGLVEDYTS